MLTKRRCLIAAGLVAACIAAALVVVALNASRPGVTKANFDRIEMGMNVAEVESILGEAGQPFHGFARRGPTLVWMGADGALVFVEVADNSVLRKEWRPSQETIPDKLRRWLHLGK